MQSHTFNLDVKAQIILLINEFPSLLTVTVTVFTEIPEEECVLKLSADSGACHSNGALGQDTSLVKSLRHQGDKSQEKNTIKCLSLRSFFHMIMLLSWVEIWCIL